MLSMPIRKPINEKADARPSFLKNKPATHLISPASHNPLDSMKKAVLPHARFYMRNGSPKSYVDQKIKEAKGRPGVGHYPVSKITNAYNFITLGAGKSWK